MPVAAADAPQMMKAVSYSSYGAGAEALQAVEMPVPRPRRDEVVVKVEACSISPLDCHLHSGVRKPYLPSRVPRVPGSDISGVVVKVGPGVTTFVPGDRVVCCLGRAGGGLAQYATAPTSATIKRRQGVSPIEGAALGTCALAALQSVRNSAGINIDLPHTAPSPQDPTKYLLIRNASSGAGTLAVQIAKLGGAHVTATCSPHNFRLLKSLGADEVVDDRGDAVPGSASGRKYDMAINCGLHWPFPRYRSELAASGCVIDLTPAPKGVVMSAAHVLKLSKQKYVPLMHVPNCADMYLLFNLLHLKKLRTVIDSTYPLAQAQAAWARCMDGHAVGKIVITCW